MTMLAALEQLFRSVLYLSPAAAVVIALMLVIRAALGNRRDPRLFHLLWVGVALRLLIPWLPPLAAGWWSVPFALMPVLQGSGARPEGPASVHGPSPALPGEAGHAAEVSPSLEWPAVSVGWPAAAGVVWMAGAVAVIAFSAAAHGRFRAALRREAPPADGAGRGLGDLLEECRAALGIRAPVALVITSLVSSPAALGLRKPAILIPQELVGRLGREEWRCVFTHELIHVRRRDALWNLLMTAFVAAHWFNPLAWMALRAMREDQELACDAAAARHVNPIQYGRVLTRVAEFQAVSGRGAAIPFRSGRSNLTRRRMEMLFSSKKTVLTLFAAICVASVSAVIAAAPDTRTGPADSDPEHAFIAPAYGTIFSGYGDAKKHNVHAVSIAAEEGTPVYAAADGVVTFAGYDIDDGKHIVIAHDGDYESVYNHLRDILVKEGERVSRGQQIGTVGSTGRSTGPQLAFELLRGGEFVDPESVITFDMPRREP